MRTIRLKLLFVLFTFTMTTNAFADIFYQFRDFNITLASGADLYGLQNRVLDDNKHPKTHFRSYKFTLSDKPSSIDSVIVNIATPDQAAKKPADHRITALISMIYGIKHEMKMPSSLQDLPKMTQEIKNVVINKQEFKSYVITDRKQSVSLYSYQLDDKIYLIKFYLSNKASNDENIKAILKSLVFKK